MKAAFTVLIISLLSISSLLFSPSTTFAARKISAQRECSTCHIMWLDEFRQKKIEPLIKLEAQPVIIAGKQGVVSTERMCFTCHDGFILDSRFAWKDKKKNFHPIGVKPQKVEIPRRKDGTEVFPLDKNGNVYCGTCHSAHGVSWEEKDSPIFLRESNKDSMMCMICHINRATGPVEGNHPVNKMSINIPEKIHQLGGKTGSIKNQVICQSCHMVHGANEKKLLLTKNSNSQLCGICHSDRYAKSILEARDMRTHPVNITSEKVKISELLIAKGGKKGEGGEIICQTCHKPHYANNGKAILVQSNIESALCRECHKDKKSVLATKHDLQKTSPSSLNSKGFNVIQSGPCSACHIPHSGKGPKMWARNISDAEDPFSNMCKSCHSTGMPGEKKVISDHSHPVNADIAKVGGETTLPLFDEKGNVASQGSGIQGKVVCPTCHNVHQWDWKDPAVTSLDEGDGTNSFLRTAAAPSPDLCANCHRNKKYVIGTDHDMRVTAPAATNIKNENIQKTGVCGQCHMIHNAPERAKLWARPLSGQGDKIAQLCLSCHNENGPARNKLTGKHSHPTGKPVSNINITIADSGKWSHPYLNAISPEERIELTPLPFFDGMGNKVIRGDVSCGSCHNPHIWNPKKASEGKGKNIDGDGTNSFLRISNDPDSSLCKNCHVEKRSVAFSKHNLKITAPKDKNLKERSAKQTGICSSCHLPHNGTGPKMWAREPYGKGDYVERLCKSCHEKGRAAKKKQVGRHTHPVGTSIRNLGILPVSRYNWELTSPDFKDTLQKDPLIALPLYAKTGEKVTDGNISCGSCHDPHQWDPEIYPREALLKKGAATKKLKKHFSTILKKIKKEEGNGTNSFLRVKNAPDSGLCKNCHIDKRPVELSKHNLNISANDEKNIQGLNTAQSGSCSACHLPHNGTGPKMWARPSSSNKNRMVGLCKSCHEKGFVAEKKQVGGYSHPVNADISKADGTTSLPLYNNRGEKVSTKLGGRVVCTTCHNPHVWNVKDIMSKEGASKDVEGTAKNSFLRKTAYPAPELCIECHENNKYVEFTDHDMSITAPTATNATGRTVKETGKCGFCHMVHNASGKKRLWSLQEGPGDDGMEVLCRSCHANSKIASAKTPKYFNHPIDIKITTNRARMKKEDKAKPLPVFKINGDRAKTGTITCPSCHNPHLWSPEKLEYGRGKNIEGNSNNSFLRGISSKAFCSDCHGFDGIFRYKYYHTKSSRDQSVPVTGFGK